jgi:hypothetical protein
VYGKLSDSMSPGFATTSQTFLFSYIGSVAVSMIA